MKFGNIYLNKGWTKEKILAQFKKYNNGKPALDQHKACIYQTEDGNRCAIGAFIPDGHKALNNPDSVNALLKEFPELMAFMPLKGIYALSAFQTAHDISDDTHGGDTYAAIESFLDTYEFVEAS